ncbi:hypothetical protein [Streptomyces sp. LUP47B]|uniref:hypothetical protein n=1 Tax=Streptomyces sp. LUP47B TaxID=1890286 RepID=UPI0008518780|nr:hypothetical protein [Streptomyces sp. LUP47B]
MPTYADLLFSKEANDTLADYIRDRIRDRVADPEVAELQCPNDHAYATKRSLFETNYYEAFNEDHVELVDVRSNPGGRRVPLPGAGGVVVGVVGSCWSAGCG